MDIVGGQAATDGVGTDGSLMCSTVITSRLSCGESVLQMLALMGRCCVPVVWRAVSVVVVSRSCRCWHWWVVAVFQCYNKLSQLLWIGLADVGTDGSLLCSNVITSCLSCGESVLQMLALMSRCCVPVVWRAVSVVVNRSCRCWHWWVVAVFQWYDKPSQLWWIGLADVGTDGSLLCSSGMTSRLSCCGESVLQMLALMGRCCVPVVWQAVSVVVNRSCRCWHWWVVNVFHCYNKPSQLWWIGLADVGTDESLLCSSGMTSRLSCGESVLQMLALMGRCCVPVVWQAVSVVVNRSCRCWHWWVVAVFQWYDKPSQLWWIGLADVGTDGSLLCSSGMTSRLSCCGESVLQMLALMGRCCVPVV